MRGVVASFGTDGWGVVRADGGVEHPFHSTAIVDGSRTIDEGVPVAFALAPGRLGRWEAMDITPTG